MDGACACHRSLRAARVRLLLGAAVLACALGLAPATAVAQAPSERYGVNVGGVVELSPELRDRHLGAMAAGGLRVARLDASWSATEPEPPDPATGAHRYRWEANDAVAGALARHGIRWYPLLAYSTPWSGRAAGDLMSPPADPAQFAAYARAFAARYGENGAFWAEHPELPRLPVAAYEIWNEPNAEMFWRGQATAPEDYAVLYLAARRAVREVDARTPVVTGGLLDANATDPNLFVRRMVRHRPEIAREIDAVGYHPYHQAYGAVLGGIQQLRSTMAAVGLGSVPIEVTEVGATTAWVGEQERASMLARLTRDVASDQYGVTRFMPFTWLASQESETRQPRPEEPELWWGLVRHDGAPLPSATAYLDAVRAATGPAPVRPAGEDARTSRAPATAAAVPPGAAAGARDRPQAQTKKPLTRKQKRRIARRILARKRRIARRMLLRKRRMARRILQQRRQERRVARRSAGSVRR
jgi:polysaccharide biosynthesis protein PslG